MSRIVGMTISAATNRVRTDVVEHIRRDLNEFGVLEKSIPCECEDVRLTRIYWFKKILWRVMLVKKVILFGAGEYGEYALNYFGESVAYFVDNNKCKVREVIRGIEVISFEKLLEIYSEYRVILSVGAKIVPILARQLEENGIYEYETFLDIVNSNKSNNGESNGFLNICKKALQWIKENSISDAGIINNSRLKMPYPEVSGYYIPSLINWGERTLACTYAKWLCSIQKEDGSWYDTKDNAPYVFDTAQILKGLIAAKSIGMDTDANIIAGCDWLISRINEEGRLCTPTKDEWGNSGECSELIHLYCLSPLIEAGKLFGKPEYIRQAERVKEFYIANYKDEILNFGFLAHFYAYVMEALCDLGEYDLAKEAMDKIGLLQGENGMIPAYKDVTWTCSTALFQFAVVWYKLRDVEHGNKAMEYAMKLQNETGGWYGGYSTVEKPNLFNRKEFPNYFEVSEISWANKYFLDALYYRSMCEFDNQAPIFKNGIDKTDGRYQVVLNEIQSSNTYTARKKVCDLGCGKGSYLKNLLDDMPENEYYAVDISKNVMKDLPEKIHKYQGLLTNLPFGDNEFDFVYTAEALEHAVYIENALKEMIRVTKEGGKIIVIDKHASAYGKLDIDSWEQWFEDETFQNIARENNCELRIIKNLSYENGVADGLFNAWVLTR